MKKNYYLLFLISLTSLAQTQIGSNINGEAANDYCGRSVSLSSDGSIVAIGAAQNNGNGTDDAGHVRVYQNVLGVWTQIGSDINGEADVDLSGVCVSLSSDGSIVAIGANANDGNGNLSGHVRVYQNVSGVWTQIGSDINGEAAYDQSGESVSLSSDGSILAIGARYNAGNGTDSGHVRVYQNVSGVWTKIGADINGEAANDNSGRSVSLSSDGSIVAIGARLNDGNGTDSGHVRVYRNISGVWTQIGADINGEAANDYSGHSVSLSSDGSIVAIGAYQNDGNGSDSGHVRVYQNISGVWTKIGSDINGEAAGDYCGYGISLSSNGSILAAGSNYSDGNGTNSGQVRIFNLTTVLASDTFVQTNFSIYPNPSNGIVNIALENNLQIEKVSIYNQLGQLVKTATTTIINATELAKGTYYVEVVTNQGKATKKIIVK